MIVVDTNLIAYAVVGAEFVVVAERLGKPLVSADRSLAKDFPARVLSPEELVTRG